MPVLLAVAVVIFVTAGVFSHYRSSAQTPSSPPPSPDASPSITSLPSPTTSPIPSLINSLSPSPTSVPTPPPTSSPSDVSGFVYPNSQNISDSTYESSDSPDQITDWYQVKINSLGYNIKTFVKTNTNDQILNKLVGANSDGELRIEISRSPHSSITQIKIRLDK